MTFGSGVHGSLGHGDYNDVIRARIVEALIGNEVEQVKIWRNRNDKIKLLYQDKSCKGLMF